ncbi:transposase [Paraburkholderia sp. WSM4174]|uniref:transposase n=1 Tax=Paraburkholderia sp. WSM4174 TaxID=2991071 RepID=UPI003D1E2133
MQAVPGLYPVTATHLIAAVGEAKRARNSRHMVASSGLTPHENSSTGEQRLLGIRKSVWRQ